MTKLDLTKTVLTEDAFKVPQLHEHGGVLWGLIAGEERPRQWDLDGNGFSMSPCLVNAPEKRSVHLNIYAYESEAYLHETRDDADLGQSKFRHRIACLEITYTPGEGLEVGDEG